MEHLKQMYYKFNNSQEFSELGNLPEATKSVDVIMEFLEARLSPDDILAAESLVYECCASNEMQGFVYGFRNCAQIMTDCVPKKVKKKVGDVA